MLTASPLRYPGGKSSMTGLVRDIRRLNGLGSRSIAEPFAGGAGASLNLLYLEETPEVHINDADQAVRDFWWSVVHRTKQFVALLESVPLSIEEWQRQRDIYRKRGRVSALARGFATFYLNRCNRSGIIVNGGPIGGIRQTGTWKIDARFNRADLRRRCLKLAEFKERLHVTGEDGLAFVRRLVRDDVVFVIDPPYFEKGPTLYLNALDATYHERLRDQLWEMRDKPWVLTYDDCPQVRKLYEGWAAVRPFSLRYTAARRQKGREVLITPKHLALPSHQGSASIDW